MSRTQPMTIEYTAHGSDQRIKFHGVVKEDHGSSNQIVSYPIQTGFNVSNHAIRKNRTITLNGIFTNTPLDTPSEYTFDEVDTSRAMFDALTALVQSARVCTVNTNLGRYTPVVFTSFKPIQEAGKMDSMHFAISGEEIQVSSALSQSSARRVSMLELTGADKREQLVKHTASGLPLDVRARVFQGTVLLGQDFILESPTVNGKAVDTTLICVGYDHVTETHLYEVHIEDDPVYAHLDLTGTSGEVITAEDDSLKSGLLGATNCLIDNVKEFTNQAANEYVDTSMGKLRKSSYGYLQEIISLGGSPLGQTLVGFALDCVSSEIGNATGNDIRGARDLIGKSVNGIDKVLEESIDGITGMAEYESQFPTVQSVITQIYNPQSGALAVVRETVSGAII